MANWGTWKKTEEKKNKFSSANERWKASITKDDATTFTSPERKVTAPSQQKPVESFTAQVEEPPKAIPQASQKGQEWRGLARNFKVAFDKKDFEDKSNSPFIKNNPYRFVVNISHPAIVGAYADYKKIIKEQWALSDEQRFFFEKVILKELQRLEVKASDYPDKPAKPKSYGYGR